MSGGSVTHISAGGWGSRSTSSASCREAVLQVLGDDRDLMARFVRASSEGLLAVRELGSSVRRELQERRHRFETHTEQLEETCAALYDVASELLPESAGANLARLRVRVDARDGESRSAVEAVEELVAGDTDALDMIIEAVRRKSDEYVLHAARQIYLKLYRLGQRWEPGNFSESIRAVMASLCPVAYDEDWAAAEIARAIIYVEGRTASGAEPEPDAEWREVIAAQRARDEPRLRAALRAVVKASVRELRDEGRLRLPEPEAEPPRDGAKSPSRKPDPPGSPVSAA